MKHCDFGVMSTAGQLLLMLNAMATMAVSTVGISVQAAILTASIICMDLLADEPSIGRIHVRPFRYHIILLYFAVQFSALMYCCCFFVVI